MRYIIYVHRPSGLVSYNLNKWKIDYKDMYDSRTGRDGILILIDWETSENRIRDIEELCWPCMYEYIKFDKEKFYSDSKLFTF